MSNLEIRKINEVYSEVRCDEGTAAELSDMFTFSIPGARFSPAFKAGYWDGKIRLFNRLNNRIYTGLVPTVVEYAEMQKYTVEYAIPSDFLPTEFTLEQAKQFVDTLNLPSKIEVRPYQLEGLVQAVRQRRAMLISPTASGKSLIMYLILMYFINVRRLKTNLIVVPNVGLVKQLTGDFQDYNCLLDIQPIHFGTEQLHKPIIITTWQTAHKLPRTWFDPFDLIVGDEAHTFKAKSLVKIMESMPNCLHRIGLTGTLDGTQTNKMVLEGLFGPVKRLAYTKELQEAGWLAELSIKAIVLNFPEEDRLAVKEMTFQEEVAFLTTHQKRNKFIRNLALSLEGNTIILFRNKDHGKAIFELFAAARAKGRKVYFIDGDVEADERERIRKLLDSEKDAIAVVSYGTFSVGTNVVRLSNIIFGSPSKQRIRVLQSIGRVLRRDNEKTTSSLYDVVDDLSWKSKPTKNREGVTHPNYMLKHFQERLSLYVSEGFPYKIYKVNFDDR